MQLTVTQAGSQGCIKLTGRFDFNCHREFRDAYEQLLGEPCAKEIVIDLAAVEYLDSSALGMLLMLRDKAMAAQKKVELSSVRGNVRLVLDIANFGKLFQIS
jgi:HptB-dependent secretion and biofilm anti anti-sigma factor